ncbi:MAG: hypothetical protein FWE36_00365 [Erysipelotrichales bacterium]|nr:hypothetical protein [Erysipelotrichales bacterium]
MKLALLIIRRAWIFGLLVCVAVLFITVNTRINLDDDDWHIIIGPDESVTTNVNVGNTLGSKELRPIGTVTDPATQTDEYTLTFKVEWTPNANINNIIGNLRIQVGRIFLTDREGNLVACTVTEDKQDDRLNYWVVYEVVGGLNHEININGYRYIQVTISLIDPGVDYRAEMISLLAGNRLGVNFLFKVNTN